MTHINHTGGQAHDVYIMYIYTHIYIINCDPRYREKAQRPYCTVTRWTDSDGGVIQDFPEEITFELVSEGQVQLAR